MAYSWRDDAACSGVYYKHGPIFWSDDPDDQALALSYCGICPVTKECEATKGPVFEDLPVIRGGKVHLA